MRFKFFYQNNFIIILIIKLYNFIFTKVSARLNNIMEREILYRILLILN